MRKDFAIIGKKIMKSISRNRRALNLLDLLVILQPSCFILEAKCVEEGEMNRESLALFLIPELHTHTE